MKMSLNCLIAVAHRITQHYTTHSMGWHNWINWEPIKYLLFFQVANLLSARLSSISCCECPLTFPYKKVFFLKKICHNLNLLQNTLTMHMLISTLTIQNMLFFDLNLNRVWTQKKIHFYSGRRRVSYDI